MNNVVKIDKQLLFDLARTYAALAKARQYEQNGRYYLERTRYVLELIKGLRYA